MLTSPSLLLVLSTLLALTTAAPSGKPSGQALEKRRWAAGGQPPESWWPFGVCPYDLSDGRRINWENPCTYTRKGEVLYDPEYPTCANDRTVTDIFGQTTVPVNVRPDCDNAIESVCRAVQRESSAASMIYMGNITGVVDSCEASIQFSLLKMRAPVSYDECVASFQQITIMCMIIGESTYAAEGSQAGIMNMHYRPPGRASAGVGEAGGVGEPGGGGGQPGLSASQIFNLEPGFMVGPPGYWKGVNGAQLTPENVVGVLDQKAAEALAKPAVVSGARAAPSQAPNGSAEADVDARARS